MGIFDRLFGKKQAPDQPTVADASTAETQNPPRQETAQPQGLPSTNSPEETSAQASAFASEFQSAVPRFFGIPSLDRRFEPRDSAGQAQPLHERYPDAFAQWTTIQSLHDRRRLIFDVLEAEWGQELVLWQRIMLRIETRDFQEALKLATAQATDTDKADVNYWVAYSRLMFVFADYGNAQSAAETALRIAADARAAMVCLADAYLFTGKKPQALAMWGEALKLSRLPSLQAAHEKLNLRFDQLVSFQGDIIYSAAYTLEWLRGDPQATEQAWNWASSEFYFSPQFRSQHAYFLFKLGKNQEGLAKLLAVAKDMPWYKEATINSYNIIAQWDALAKLPKEVAYLRSVMQANGWHPEQPGDLHAVDL